MDFSFGGSLALLIVVHTPQNECCRSSGDIWIDAGILGCFWGRLFFSILDAVVCCSFFCEVLRHTTTSWMCPECRCSFSGALSMVAVDS